MDTQTLNHAVRGLDQTRRRQIRRLATVRVLWLGLSALWVCFYLDSILVLGESQRVWLNVMLGGVAVGIWGATVWHFNRAQSRRRMLARLIEREHPELHNELINAIDFEERLEQQDTGQNSVALMQQEIERAVMSFGGINNLDSLRPRSLRRECRLLWALVGIWACCILFCMNWFQAELPRFVMPWSDHPPYSATRLTVSPAGAVVDYGGDLAVEVTAEGQQPETLWLNVQDPVTGDENQIGMFSTREGQYHQTIEQIRTDLVYYASAGRGRSKRHVVTLSKVPLIESIELHYRYPTYTNLPERASRLSDDKPMLKGYRGTEVALTITSNRPLKQGEITLNGESVLCTPQDTHSVQGVVTLSKPGTFEVTLTDVEGFVSTRPFSGDIELVPDGKPFIAVVSPGMHALAIPTAEVPIVTEASDDLGIDRVTLFLSHNKSRDTRRPLYSALEIQTQVSATHTLKLADLGVMPGDMIDYYATATDSEPRTPQTAATEAYTLQIISAEEFAQMKQDEMTAKDLRVHYDAIMAELDELVQSQEALEQETRELIEGMEEPNNPSEAQQQQLAALAKQQAALAQKTDAFADKLREEAKNPPVFDIEKDYKASLSKMADQLDKAVGHMQDSTQQMAAGQASPQTSSSAMRQANESQKEALAAMGKETQAMREAIAKANEELEKMMDLIGDIETFKQLYLAQKHLARQTKSLQDIEVDDLENLVRFKALAEREMAIKGAIEQLSKDLYVHADAVAEEYPDVTHDAYAIAANINVKKIPELMGMGSEFLNHGQGPNGHAKVQEALDQMESMIAFCEGAAGSACKQCSFRLQIKMSLDPGNTLAQLSLGLNPGMGMGMGAVGALGRGSSGYAGGQSDMALFGNETFGKNSMKKSLRGGGKKSSEAGSLPDVRNPLAGNIEQLAPQAKRDMPLETRGEGAMMSEYRKAIEAYFQRLAEDE
ncbi:MAG: hypothetical protein GY809_26245 [Planctomycetes bacterium]|nr:hypothetical protein [Planctomycetota bacterium]